MNKRSTRQNSGQILLLAVLVITLLMLSTQLYIYEVGKSMDNVDSAQATSVIFAIQLGSKHVVTSSLANISHGGERSVLSTNLEDWCFLIGRYYQSGTVFLSYTLPTTPPYSDGTYVSWGTNGLGITSAIGDFNLSMLDQQLDIRLFHRVNITTAIFEETAGRTLQNTSKQVDVTFNLSNDGFPALARNISVQYRISGLWKPVDESNSYRLIDYGNGTYVSSFEVDTPQNTVDVSVLVRDLRGIYVQANTTCIITS
jgi:hypothetical protein